MRDFENEETVLRGFRDSDDEESMNKCLTCLFEEGRQYEGENSGACSLLPARVMMIIIIIMVSTGMKRFDYI